MKSQYNLIKIYLLSLFQQEGEDLKRSDVLISAIHRQLEDWRHLEGRSVSDLVGLSIMSEEGTNNNDCNLQSLDHQQSVSDDPTVTPRPFHTFFQLITEAISSTDNKQMSLNEICLSISSRHPFYSMDNKGWQ